MSRPVAPQLTSGKKSDPLRDAFGASNAVSDGGDALFKSPAPR